MEALEIHWKVEPRRNAYAVVGGTESRAELQSAAEKGQWDDSNQRRQRDDRIAQVSSSGSAGVAALGRGHSDWQSNMQAAADSL